MKTVKEVSKLTGVSIRALHHYDAVGLLKPTQVTDAGYRLYDEVALDRLYMILVYRELGLSLNESVTFWTRRTTTETGCWSTRLH